jgi:hypothetical protein
MSNDDCRASLSLLRDVKTKATSPTGEVAG